MKKDWKLYANHILDCIAKINQIKARGDITKDDVLYDAALRNLQTLSEATRHLPEDKTAQYSTVPWKNISGFRNILVHDYLGEIDPHTVLKVIDTHLAVLEVAIIDMLKN
ncbi:MAG: DUF86 domain-containing protein [Gammaproteobacteria bacterium]